MKGKEERKIFPIILGAIVLIAVLVLGGLAFRYYIAPIKGKVEMREKVYSGKYRFYSYEHFYNMYADIQAYQDQIENQKQLLKTVSNSDEKDRINRNIVGLKNRRDATIRQYNADARKEGTQGKFRAGDLPYQIDKNY